MKKFFFTIFFSFKLKKYQHNTGTAVFNLGSNFSRNLLTKFSYKTKQLAPPPPIFVKVVEITQKNHIFQCFAPWFALLNFQPC